jgi:hypothetical protein
MAWAWRGLRDGAAPRSRAGSALLRREWNAAASAVDATRGSTEGCLNADRRFDQFLCQLGHALEAINPSISSR